MTWLYSRQVNNEKRFNTTRNNGNACTAIYCINWIATNRKGTKKMTLVKSYISDTELYHDLKKMGRDNFSYEGAKALMEYLEQLSEDIGENIEYDPVAFCCDYAEYVECEYEDLANEYSDAPKLEDYDGQKGMHADYLIEWLQEQTTVIEFNGGIIVQAF